MKTIYLAVIEDRHSNDAYSAFGSLEDAIEQCDKWVREYEGRYEFVAPDWEWQRHYEYYLDAGDECPKASVQKIPLDELQISSREV